MPSDVVRPTWSTDLDSSILGQIYDYIASYGIALGLINIGFMRGLTDNIFGANFEQSDCFEKAHISSEGIERLFNVKNYNNELYNIMDATNLFSKL